MAQSSVPVTKLGNYGDNATPAPTAYEDTVYTASTVSFVAAAGDDPAYLLDYAKAFADNHFQTGSSIVVTTDSGTNDGTYTIADRGVSRDKLLLSDDDSLTDEDAATAGSVVIARSIYEPSITTGCPFCGSLASK